MKLKLFCVTLTACLLLLCIEGFTQTCSRANANVSLDSDKRLPPPATGDCTYDVVAIIDNPLGTPTVPFRYGFTYNGDGNITDIIIDDMSQAPDNPGGNTITIESTGGPLTVTFVVEAPCNPVGDAGVQIFGQSTNALDTSPDFCEPATAVLPVELNEFKATLSEEEDLMILNWETSSELENAGFDVQRSEDAKNWKVLDFVNGFGTSSESRQYEWYDQAPIDLAYYRLKQIDFDGRYEYSPVVVAEKRVKKEGLLTAYPIPTTRNIYWQTEGIETEEAQIYLYDQFGSLLKQCAAEAGIMTVSDLARGMYILTLRTHQQQFHKRIIKQ